MGLWEFILCVIGIGTIGGVLKSWGHAANGGKHGKRKADPAELAELGRMRAENVQLRERLEMHEDRLITLEKIVTDSGYDLARQIERLRDQPTLPRIDATRDRDELRSN